jgi:hypothetical protein
LHDHQPLFAFDFHGQGRAARHAQHGMTLLDGQLNVLRIMIAPANDDQIFEAAGDQGRLLHAS